MKYLLLIKHSESLRSQTIPEGLMAAMDTFVTAAMKSGIMLDTGGLKPTSEASIVTMRNATLTVTDGPFSESKEIVGGYAMIDVKTRKEAMDLAMQFMELHRIHWPTFEGACEVRPLEDFEAA